MRKVLITALIFVGLATQFALANKNQEFRSIWVITWEHINRYNSTEENKANVRKILDNIKAANMTSVIWQARQGGTAYYQSSYEPWGFYAGKDGENHVDPGYDPLAYAVEQAHLRGLEIHAWFNVFQTSSTYPGSVAEKHPDWICTNASGKHMTSKRSVSPGLKAVRDYTVDVAMEIVHNYDIDGFHLDYVRWNEYDESDMSPGLTEQEQVSILDGPLSEEKVNSLKKTNGNGRYFYDVEHPASGSVPEGYSSWADWRRASVTKFVAALQDSIKKVKPWVRLSPAALGKYNWSGWNGYEIVFQDAAHWLNEGYIDQLMGMHYHWTTANGFYGMLQGDCPNCWGNYVQKGVNAGRMYTVGPGSYILHEQKVWHNHPSIIEKARTVDWVDGFQFFSYGNWEDYDYWDDAAGSFFANKTKIKPHTWLSTNSPDAPTIELNKIDDLKYSIGVTPATTGENAWYAVYRSEDDNIDPDNDKILEIGYGSNGFTYVDVNDGSQDFNGKYRYYATVLNRFWNESPQSLVMLSDSIPSLPPALVSSNPAEGDSIAVDAKIVLNFSKAIDLGSAENAFSLEPQIDFSSVTWSADKKMVTFAFAENLPFDTQFTLSVDDTLRDINGVKIQPGGYQLHFKTLKVDNVAPVIVQQYPMAGDTKVDTRQFITVTFNELIDAETLTDVNVVLYEGIKKTPITIKINNLDNKSILSILPQHELSQNTEYAMFLSKNIADTTGNILGKNVVNSFTTGEEHYTKVKVIESFTNPTGWWQPNGSGSTVGLIVHESGFGFTKDVTAIGKDAASLKFSWDESASLHLLREYLPPNEPKNKPFDTTYTVQTYVFGDGSNAKFRIALDEGNMSGNNFSYVGTEVMKWVTIDWYGWRLVEWKLTDEDAIGTWISNDNKITESTCRMDSYQLSYESGVSAQKGRIYLDELRVVKKSKEPSSIDNSGGNAQPQAFTLFQNYPNPFNPVTKIKFNLSEAAKTVVTVYDMRGRVITKLHDGYLNAGLHQLAFNAAGLASGIYIYEVRSGVFIQRKKMTLLK